jgi:hypothetical protein
MKRNINGESARGKSSPKKKVCGMKGREKEENKDWSHEEDDQLKKFAKEMKYGNWRIVCKKMAKKKFIRTMAECKERWEILKQTAKSTTTVSSDSPLQCPLEWSQNEELLMLLFIYYFQEDFSKLCDFPLLKRELGDIKEHYYAEVETIMQRMNKPEEDRQAEGKLDKTMDKLKILVILNTIFGKTNNKEQEEIEKYLEELAKCWNLAKELFIPISNLKKYLQEIMNSIQNSFYEVADKKENEEAKALPDEELANPNPHQQNRTFRLLFNQPGGRNGEAGAINPQNIEFVIALYSLIRHQDPAF